MISHKNCSTQHEARVWTRHTWLAWRIKCSNLQKGPSLDRTIAHDMLWFIELLLSRTRHVWRTYGNQDCTRHQEIVVVYESELTWIHSIKIQNHPGLDMYGNVECGEGYRIWVARPKTTCEGCHLWEMTLLREYTNQTQHRFANSWQGYAGHDIEHGCRVRHRRINNMSCATLKD